MTKLFLAFMSSLMITSTAAAEHDPHSYARPWEVAVTDIHLKLNVDFDHQILTGSARLTLDRRSGDVLSLDTRDLKIMSVLDGESGFPLEHSYGREDANFGRELIVQLRKSTRSVVISYATSPGAHALQWLKPAQTLGKKHPFLFTQSQSIHARSWIPLQDTPEVRTTYSAEITVPPDLLPLMSAENPQVKSKDGVYRFQMPQPIPSYLIALAVGDLEFKELGERTGVYAEPAGLEAAAWELENMEKMLKAGEKVTGLPYQWDRYDTLILPPSFPFGGMENPRLTFATPTVIIGDRSQESLHAHEASHSWTGNFVTNKNMNHFWLNEGFTVYLERRIIEEMYGPEIAELQARIGFTELERAIEEQEPRFTTLHADLTGIDPDDVYSVIPYEKGYLFLRHIEGVIGRAAFDQFLQAYIRTFAFKSIGTEDFEKFLEATLVKGDQNLRDLIDAKTWLESPGLPDKRPVIHSPLLTRIDRLVTDWTKTGKLDKEVVREFSTNEWVYFLSRLPEKLSKEELAELDREFKLTASNNPETLTEWLSYAIAKQYGPALTRVGDFLRSVGRGKFVKPLFAALEKGGQRDLAQRIFQEAAEGYHNIVRTTVQRAHKFEDCEASLTSKN